MKNWAYSGGGGKRGHAPPQIFRTNYSRPPPPQNLKKKKKKGKKGGKWKKIKKKGEKGGGEAKSPFHNLDISILGGGGKLVLIPPPPNTNIAPTSYLVSICATVVYFSKLDIMEYGWRRYREKRKCRGNGDEDF